MLLNDEARFAFRAPSVRRKTAATTIHPTADELAKGARARENRLKLVEV
jgi:hypothetical protein